MAGIAIIGGGVIGCATAAWMAAGGHEVTVFERRPEDRHASSGNAGLLAFPEITPLARPGVARTSSSRRLNRSATRVASNFGSAGLIRTPDVDTRPPSQPAARCWMSSASGDCS